MLVSPSVDELGRVVHPGRTFVDVLLLSSECEVAQAFTLEFVAVLEGIGLLLVELEVAATREVPSRVLEEEEDSMYRKKFPA